jgi:NAD-dependent DNA ligase
MKSKIVKIIKSKSKKKRDFETKFLDLCRQVQQTKKRKTKDMSHLSIHEDTKSDEKIASLVKIQSPAKIDSPVKVEEKEKEKEKEKVSSLEKIMPALVEKKKRIYTKKNKLVVNADSKKDIDIPEESTKMAITKERQLAALSNIESFKTNGLSFIETFSQSDLDDMLIVANDMYYNQGVDGKQVLMTDNEYDIVKEFTSSKFPKDLVVDAVGAPIVASIAGKKLNKVKLPFEMWSMDKIKPDSGSLATWKKKYVGGYVVSVKLDGVSGLYAATTDAGGKGVERKLYTRGDGKYGQDVSHLIPFLKLPEIAVGVAVRGEFIIDKKVFKTKYSELFANPRNMVSGIVNSKTADEKAKDVHFVAYECITPVLKPSKQFETLLEYGFEVAEHRMFSDAASLTNEALSDYLVDRRTNYDYEIDGIIVSDDKIYDRVSGNPDHSFAFKMVLSDQKAEAKVVDVLWEASKAGLLKPRVRIEPTKLGGVTITYLTGHNARKIKDDMIGVGAIIQMIRSGDVIPKIVGVSVPAEKPKMPSVPYVWNESGVDVVIENVSDDKGVQEKNIVAFFTEIGVEGLKAGNVGKIVEGGFDTIPKIISMTKQDFSKIGFKTTAEKFAVGIKEKLLGATLVQVMVGSGLMGAGIGHRKIEPILEKFPDILTSSLSHGDKIEKMKLIDGIGPETAGLFVSNIDRMVAFLKECNLEYKLILDKKADSGIKASMIDYDKSNPLFGLHVVMTKVRDDEIIAALKKNGGFLDDTIKKTTSVLVVKTMTDVSNKTKYAVDNKIPIMTPDEFKKTYM